MCEEVGGRRVHAHTFSLSLSLSLSHTHTHTHTPYIVKYDPADTEGSKEVAIKKEQDGKAHAEGAVEGEGGQGGKEGQGGEGGECFGPFDSQQMAAWACQGYFSDGPGMQRLGFRVQGLRFRVQGLGLRV